MMRIDNLAMGAERADQMSWTRGGRRLRLSKYLYTILFILSGIGHGEIRCPCWTQRGKDINLNLYRYLAAASRVGWEANRQSDRPGRGSS